MSPVHPVKEVWVKTPSGIHPVAGAGSPGPSPVAPGAPGDPQATAIAQTTVSISWSASTVPAGGSLATYRLYRDGTKVGETLALSYTFGGLAADTGYTLGVSAVSDEGMESAVSTVGVRTAAVPSGGPRMLIGAWINPGTAAEWARVEGLLGRSLQVRRSYAAGAPSGTFSGSPAGIDAGKRASWLSWKGDLATMRDGGYNSALSTFLASVPSGHRLIVSFRHEPENDGIADPAVYRAALRTFYQQVKSLRPATTVAQIVYMGFTFAPGTDRNPEDWYPGNDYVDWIGLDIYNPPALGKSPWQSVPWANLTNFLAFANGKGKPWAVGEFGTAEDASNPSRKADWLRDFAAWCSTRNCQALCYFSSYKAGDTVQSILLDSSVPALAAYAQIIDTYGVV